MNPTDFAPGQIWAITPPAMDVLTARLPEILKNHEAAANFTESPDYGEFQISDGAAIIPMNGPLTRRGSFWSYLYGATPLPVVQNVIEDALRDPQVRSIVLAMDSPGGQVAGTEAFTDFLRRAKEKKPIIAHATTMASAAYWIGSAADRIIVDKTAQVGSIGVIMTHFDFSKMDADMGLKRTILSVGKFKAIGNDAEPLTDVARKILEAEMTYVYDIFIETVATNLGVDAAAVRATMADGQIFIGRQAVDIGLAHEVGTLDAAVAAARDFKRSPFFSTSSKERNMEVKTKDDLVAAFPDLVKQVQADARNEAQAMAATDQTDRILGLAAVHFGKEQSEQFAGLVKAGVTVEQYQAFAAARPAPAAAPEPKAHTSATNQQILDNLTANSPTDPGADPLAGSGQAPEFQSLVRDYMRDHKCTRAAAQQAIRADHPASYQAYIKAQQKK